MVAPGIGLSRDEERRRILYATAVLQGSADVPPDFDWHEWIAKKKPLWGLDVGANLAAKVLAGQVALVYGIEDPLPIVQRLHWVCNTFAGGR